MAQSVTLPSPIPPGLVESAIAAGISLYGQNGEWMSDTPVAVSSFVSSYDPLPWLRAQALATVASTLASHIAAGFTYQGVTVEITGEASVVGSPTGNIDAMAAIASNTIAGTVTTAWPTGFGWVGKGTTATIPLSTPQAMVAFAAATGHYKSALIQYANNLEAQIEAATTAAAVQSIDLTSGWPTS